ncbi:MFS transporter [Bacteroidota bacterium]
MHYRDYIRATGINILFSFCIYVYYPILAPYIKNIGLDDFQTGLVFAIVPLAMIFSSPIMGKLADEIGRNRVIIIGFMIEIVAMALYLVGGTWWIVTIARFLDAIALAGVSLVVLAKIEDALTDKERGKYAGWSFSLTHIGAIVAPVIGGLIADRFFVKAPFIFAAFLLLAMAFYLAFRTRKTTKKVQKSDFNIVSALKNFISIRPLKGIAVLGMVMHATTPAISVFLPLFIIEKLGLSYSYVGVALFFAGVVHVFQFHFGKLNDKHGREAMILLGCFIYGLFMFFLAFTQTYWLLLIVLLLLGTGSAIWNVSAWTLMSDIGEKIKKEGEVVGSYMSIAKIGAFISFLFSGLIVQLYGVQILFMTNAFLIAIGILIASVYFDREHEFSKKIGKTF